jgi:hypothetical protein
MHRTGFAGVHRALIVFLPVLAAAPCMAQEQESLQSMILGFLPVHFWQDMGDYRTDVSLTVAAYDFTRPFGANGMLWDMPETMTVALSESSIMNSLVAGTIIRAIPDGIWGVLAAEFALGAVCFVDEFFPGGMGWLHEEWHRAVLVNRGISAQDDMIFFPLLRNLISVSHVTDEDLAMLKAGYPADFVRLAEAGPEGSLSLAFQLKERAFFQRDRFDLDRLQAFVSAAYVVNYLWRCAFGNTDEALAEANAAESSSIHVRDIIGFDFLTWVYDLFRPDEPYAARGVHPSGLGVNRYISQSQLSQAEKDYLALQAGLSLINVALGGFDPVLPDRFSFSAFDTRVDLSASIRHYLTSSGFLIDSTAMGRAGDLKLALSLRNYFNYVRWFPGADILLYELPLRFGSCAILVTAEGAFWWQPAGQSFTTTTADFGGSGRLRLEFPVTEGARLYVEGDAKSAGWQEGTVELDPAYHIRGGMRFRM